VAGLSESLFFFEIPAGKLIKEISGHDLLVPSVTFSPDGQYLATCDFKTVKIRRVKGLELIQQIEILNSYMHKVIFSPDGQTIIITSDHQIKIVNLENIENAETLKLKPKGIYGIAVSPFGNLLAMGAADKKIRIWELFL